MHNDTATATLRADYRAPDFQIRTVDLDFDLDRDRTLVRNRMTIERVAVEPVLTLRLDGAGLETIDVLLDDMPAAFRIEDDALLVAVPEAGRFTLEIINACAPSRNTALSGLYVSGGGLYTQCEAAGFRRITWFLDRPDVMAVYTVTLRADRAAFPVLLSNGNLGSKGDLPDGRHYAVWHDPFPKPSYLFALVAADLRPRRQMFESGTGKTHLLEVYADKHDEDKTEHAMDSLVAAIRWDEQRFGLPLDLDRFMLVGVADFNAGAMENKGLNIFNTAALLASPRTATDTDYEQIASTVAHEYFHNWTGNRVTCRDWFQLSLKEGLTVFRHQEFAQDMAGTPSARAVCRIRDVRLLRSLQFPEDSGTMTHPVRPDRYREISNFYTATVYGKGAEVVRMMQALVGRDGFAAGLALYFERHDGQAVTCDDLVAALADANPDSPLAGQPGVFKRWYAQAGTPRLTARGVYDPMRCTYTLTLRQAIPPTPAQPDKLPLMIPVTLGLLDWHGRALPLHLRGTEADCGDGVAERVLVLDRAERTFVFERVASEPVPSLLRGFSAPVILDDGLANAQLLLLLRYDSDPFNRWEAGQRLLLDALVDALRHDRPLELDDRIVAALRAVLRDPTLSPAFKDVILTLPAEAWVAEQLDRVDPQAIHAAVHAARRQLGDRLHEEWVNAFEWSRRAASAHAARADHAGASGPRALANLALSMLVAHAVANGDAVWPEIALRRFVTSSNMTDKLGALAALVDAHAALADSALASFLDDFANEPLVVDKWFALQARAFEQNGRVLERARALLAHPAFSLANPNRARSVLGSLCLSNPGAFHRPDGAGYELWAEQLIRLDALNPQLAGRLARALDGWNVLAEPYRHAAGRTLTALLAQRGLSGDVREILERAAAADA